MGKPKMRARGSNWNHAHTVALAELKREASLNKEDGRLVWERIARTLSSRFPGQIRTGAQCRRRWDTLVKDYNHIKKYCVETGKQNHRELDEGAFACMKLPTAYQQDWYDIVEEVCSQRKRKERRSKGSHSIGLPERFPNRDTLGSASTSKPVRHYEQSTTTYAQVSCSPSLEVDKVILEEEVVRPLTENDCLMVEATQLGQHGQVSNEFFQEPQVTRHEQSTPEWTVIYAQVSSSPSLEVDNLSPVEEVERFYIEDDGLGLEVTGQHGQVSQEPLTLVLPNLLPLTWQPVKNGDRLEEDDFWDSVEAMPMDCSAEIEESETESFGLGAQPKEALQHHVRDDSFETANESRATESNFPTIYSGETATANRSLFFFVFLRAWLYTKIMVSCMSSRSEDSTIPRQSRRWSLKVILLKIRQYCHKCARKSRTEGMEMESKQAARLKEKARKKAPMPRMENVPAMLDAASSTSAASATRGDKLQVLPEPQMPQVLQKDTERISNSAAVDEREEETMSFKVERQQLVGKSSTKCVPVGKLCELSRRLFPAYLGQSLR